ncbi:hypothetical protein DXG01_002604 [Tephrocybe rancida]|nr:hypothetical protein DXG01_002604 [Tephrocybe rancida]
MSEQLSIRVNSARLPEFVGQTVRLAGRVLQRSADTMTVEASDGGEVAVQMFQVRFILSLVLPVLKLGADGVMPKMDASSTDPYVEVIGKAVDATTVKMMSVVNLGSDFDLKLANDTIEFMHDKKLFSRMFS